MRNAARGVRKECIALALGAALGALPACASGGGAPAGSARVNRNLVTADEMARGQWMNAHDAIRALRPRWLINRGPDTILGEMGDVQVLLDGVPIGRPAVLLQLPVADIAYMSFVEPTAAAARWGPKFAHGVIYVSTRP